ncbi:dephospho-CoA kinase [Inconstantimicrobium mannanitabidum]|uniref:Dephospho-CoA kinase n=1 Tax=Inconstantimicrobium mannanitabidum TaxID=1604901 RepID=A0ACB5RC58_9CLOT|nr:dephospho-CoA kinase [Clostridium sp. TW13]GKX66828.1 dephospho-CoA kinase [Clostridium sp. TW13]
MIKIGLTGGIGTGKSTVSMMLKDANFKIIDADTIAKDVLKKYPQILNEVRVKFGTGFFDWRGEFRRREFGNHIFRFPKERIKYEELVMPYILKEINSEFDKYNKSGEKLVILDAPTLIENNFHENMDFIVLVWVDINTQIGRVKERDKLPNNDIINRINAQMSLEQKKDFADFLINNSGSLVDTKIEVEKLIEYFNLLTKK